MKSNNSYNSESFTLYAVTDRAWLGESTLARQVEQAILGGVTIVQLREKELDDESFLNEAFEVKSVCQKHGVPFIINDNVEIAIKCGADGVHIGQSDMSVSQARQMIGDDKMLGVSVQTVSQAKEAIDGGANVLGVGAVFPTSSKDDADCVSLDTLTEICSMSCVPVVAIGGICEDNIMKLENSGIAGVAVISAIFSRADITRAAREMLNLAKRVVV